MLTHVALRRIVSTVCSFTLDRQSYREFKWNIVLTYIQCFQYASHCNIWGIQKWAGEKKTLNIVVFRLLTGCSVAIKSIPHCQWSWSSLNLNEEMLVVLLLVWDLYTPGAMDSIYCALCHTVQTDCWGTDFLLDTKSLLYCVERILYWLWVFLLFNFVCIHFRV